MEEKNCLQKFDTHLPKYRMAYLVRELRIEFTCRLIDGAIFFSKSNTLGAWKSVGRVA